MVKWMQRFFQYLDRFYVEINSLTPLSDQGFKIFNGVVFQPLITNITQAIISAIDRERREELVDIDILKKTVDIYLFLSDDKLSQDTLNCRKYLEDKIIEHTREFYRKQSQDLLHTASLSEYLQCANQFFMDEAARLDRYLNWDSVRTLLMKEFKNEMLLKHQQTLLERETGIKYLLQHDKVEDLGLLFSLFSEN